LVYLVSFVQPKKPDKPNKQNKQDRREYHDCAPESSRLKFHRKLTLPTLTGNASFIMVSEQDAEKVRQLRSRIVQILNVPRGYASGLHSLRPCWTAILSILLESAHIVPLD